jgi:hypothetical protein
MWLSAIKLAVSAGSKIYANKQKTKMAMSDAQLMHAERMAKGEEAYQGKLLEARQSKVDLAKLKGGSKKLQTSIDEVRAAMREKARVKKMGGGFMGRRMGYSQGSNGKPVSKSKNPGLLKMSKSEKGKAVVKKFGYNPNRIVAKKGGKA